MVKNPVRSIQKARHFWRYATFTEVGILYVARIMRTIALKIVGGAIFIYLVKIGYPFWAIAALMVFYYIVKVVSFVLSAFFVSKFGPKHSMILGNLLYIPALLLTTLAKEFGFGAAIAAIGFQAASVAVYEMAMHIDFSKVKTAKVSGRQIGVGYVFEKLSAALAPIIGGVVAMVFGATSMLIFSAIIFAMAAIPLLMTKEPIRANQKINFRNFSWHIYRRNLLAQSWAGFLGAHLNMWSVFAPIFIFSAFNAFGAASVMSSISAAISVIAALILGKIADKGSGLKIIRVATLAQAVALFVNGAFVKTPIHALLFGAASDLTTVAQNMGNTKGTYDDADKSGSRIVYIMLREVVANVAAVIASAILLICILLIGGAGEHGVRAFYMISSLGVLPLMFVDYSVYRSKERGYKER